MKTWVERWMSDCLLRHATQGCNRLGWSPRALLRFPVLPVSIPATMVWSFIPAVCVVASAFFPRLCTCSWCYFIIALGASCYRGEEGARRISCPQSQSKDWSWSLKVDEAGTEFGESAEGIWATPGDVRPKDRVVVSFPVRNLVKQQGHKEMTAWVGPSMIWLVAVCWV